MGFRVSVSTTSLLNEGDRSQLVWAPRTVRGGALDVFPRFRGVVPWAGWLRWETLDRRATTRCLHCRFVLCRMPVWSSLVLVFRLAVSPRARLPITTAAA